jgi:predicted ferric reductase
MTTLADPAMAAASPEERRMLARRGVRAGRGRRRLADPMPWVIAIGLVTLGLWAVTGGMADLVAGGMTTVLSVSRLAGLVAALAALLGLVLTARPGWLERSYGLDRLVGWHRWTGIAAAFGMVVHVGSALVAAGGGIGGSWQALVDLVTGTDWFLAALVAAALFAVVSLTSWRRVRRHLQHETWHVLHAVGYLAILLGFPHQLLSGTTVSTSLVTQLWWIGLYVATFGIVAASRVGGVARSVLRPRTTVDRVVPEAPGVASLVITGPGVDRLAARPGQFVCLRVLTRDLWWQAHPYSLSAAPHPGALRITIKALGDASSATIAVRPGTRVLLEGPYGAMTIERAGGRRVVLLGAGVGLAPMRALLEACVPAQAPIVLARGHSDADLPLAAELASLARDRGGVLLPVTGPRGQFRDGNPFTAESLLHHVPDLQQRAVFLCGPNALTDRVRRELARAGVPDAQVHVERFAW